MDLSTAVKKYLEISGGFNRPVHLSLFGLSKSETEKMMSAWDEDYQISRYMQLACESDEALSAFPGGTRVYTVNGFECSHVSFHPDIQKLL